MSVQVRRRREAAAFLASFVGAQGELLVDTTNNRVQVHDGTTPGGWPAARIVDLGGRNAAINGNFAINQRAYASGTALAASVYAHDRWKAGTTGATYTFAASGADTNATITAGTLVQAVEAANVGATAYWLSWTGTAQARVWQGTASGAFSAGTSVPIDGVAKNTLLVAVVAGTIANLEFSTGTLGLVQFEAASPNSGATRFERRFIGQELFLCQRYFQLASLSLRAPASAGSQQFELTAFYTPMRATPTAALWTAGTRGNLQTGTPAVFFMALASARFNIVSNAAEDTYVLTDVWSFAAEI